MSQLVFNICVCLSDRGFHEYLMDFTYVHIVIKPLSIASIHDGIGSFPV